MSADTIHRLNLALEGRYRIERNLGEGGMATVYLAEDLRHGRRVAVKVLKPELAAVLGADRFLAEIKTTAGLQHPNILALHDSGEADGLLFYVMPFVSGESLKDRLDREGQVPVEEAVRIVSGVAEALDYAHRQGVIHRDIKPANILLQDGNPVISDFGIALAVGALGGGRLTETGLSLGTPHYMSPEQATGDQHLGAPTDVYSLGCVLYDMLAGEPPFTGGTPQAVLGKIMMAERPTLSALRRSVPGHVEAVVNRALEPFAADRFTTPGELAKALADPSFTHGNGGQSATVVFGRARLVGVLAFVAGAAGATAVGVLMTERQGAEDPGDFVFEVPGPVSNAQGRAVAISDDGRLIAMASSPGEGSVRSVRRSAEVLAELPSRASQPFFSPDGAWVAYFLGVNATLHKMRSTGGVSVFVAEVGERALGGTWLDDGTIVFSTVTGLHRVSEEGGPLETLLRPDASTNELYLAWPEALPDGRAVLFTTVRADAATDGDSEIEIIDVGNGSRRLVLPRGAGGRYASGRLVYSAGSALHSVAFDVGEATVSGEPVPLGLDGVALPRGTGADFDVADDGTLVLRTVGVVSEAPRVLAWVDRDGGVETLNAPERRYTYPRVSPDGRRILVDVGGSNRDIYMYDVDRDLLDRVTRDPGEDLFAEWSPDGSSMFFSSDREGTLRGYHQPLGRIGPAVAVTDGATARMVTDVSPDGSGVVLSHARPGGTDFDLAWMGSESGSEPSVLLSTDASESHADVSPDGSWVAYQSDASGAEEIYVGRIDALDRERTRVSTNGGGHPVWHPSGRELYFRGLDGSLNVVPVSPGDPVAVGDVERLFPNPGDRFAIGSGRRYDPSRTDDRILFVLVGAGGTPGRVMVRLGAVSGGN